MRQFLKIFVFLIISCRQVPDDNMINLLRPSSEQSIINSDISEKYRIVSLSSFDSMMIGSELNCKVLDSLLVINDIAGSRKVVVFNIDNGKLLNIYSLKGSGPNELQYIHDFVLEKEHNEFFDFSQGKQINIGASTFEANNLFGNRNPMFIEKDNANNYWYYYSWGIGNESPILSCYNMHGENLGDYFKIKSNAIPFEINPFSKVSDVLYFSFPFDKNLYKIKNGKLLETFKLSYEQDVPANFHTGNFFDVFDKMNRRGFYMINKYFENKNYVYLNYRFQKSEFALNVHFLKNKHSGLVHYFSSNSNSPEFELGSAIAITDSNELIFVLHPYVLKKLNLNDLPVSIIDNPYVLFLKIKI